ncbi:hypothetical protein BZA05DRAFT_404892 [Tricharina praecox]|uniref:uncharacterized protein n=1 Tax=Tricharina praecox TaxID=43433 RepID=UPI002220C3EB|nr:uncharacterized protein BZA05DRAFT_404892 [Tricharina praecox]KAI5847461.1 hypothetical protein BZA05DRAFT_404892 [Tricharina praecox]
MVGILFSILLCSPTTIVDARPTINRVSPSTYTLYVPADRQRIGSGTGGEEITVIRFLDGFASRIGPGRQVPVLRQ